jgi:RNA 2',3'-cyclic 3'-phosphodiesterase
MHLTLKFLGQTNHAVVDKIEEILKEIAENKNPYDIKLHGLGVFPNKNYIKIIWMGVNDNGETKNIADEIDEELSKIGFKKEKRKFHPHLTLARVKSAKNKDKIIDIIHKYENHVFQESIAETIELKKSELTAKGPIYSTLKKINL